MGQSVKGEPSQWFRHLAVIPDGPAVEVGEYQELLKLLSGVWGWPLGHSQDFGWVRKQLALLHDEPQKGHSEQVELALLLLHEQAVLEQTSQNQENIVYVPPPSLRTRESSR